MIFPAVNRFPDFADSERGSGASGRSVFSASSEVGYTVDIDWAFEIEPARDVQPEFRSGGTRWPLVKTALFVLGVCGLSWAAIIEALRAAL
jgi:hypothetical protein